MQVADTRASLILALKNDKNSARWEEFVNQYYAYLHYAAATERRSRRLTRRSRRSNRSRMTNGRPGFAAAA